MQVGEFPVHEAGSRTSFLCRADETLLAGAIRSGTGAIPVGCRAGGCGMCKVRITAGDYRTGKMSRTHVSEAEEREGFVLACRTHITGAVEICRPGIQTPHSKGD